MNMAPFELKPEPDNAFYRCVEDCNEAIMITTIEGTLIYVNPAWCKIYGYSKSEAIGNTPRLLHSGYQSTEFYQKMWESILNPKLGNWKGEIVNKAKDGTLVPVLLTITPIRDKENRVAGHMGIALDISSQKQLESKVLQQDRLASIGILASGLAHEIGTPLGVVRGRAEYLAMQPDSKKSPILNSGLQTIVTQIDRISKLISSLLRYSRATDDVRTQEINLNEVIAEVTNLLGQNIKSSSIDFKVDVPPNFKVVADFNRLQQIFLNLLVNSIHAIQKASTDGQKSSNAIVVRAEKGGPLTDIESIISVSDTGCGIPPENMKKLFQPFFTTKDVGEGTGLGLAIVSKLVQEMNGEITVESTPSRGTTFTLFLRKHAKLIR